MALHVYEKTGPGTYVQISEGDSFTNPLTTPHHGRDGNTFEQRFYVRSDNAARTDTQIQVLVDDGTGGAWVDIDPGLPGASGWGVKLMSELPADRDATEEDWAAINYGDPVDIPDIVLDDTVYRTFWYRIESPRSINIGNKTNIELYLAYKEV
jgi:hypothetical protein